MSWVLAKLVFGGKWLWDAAGRAIGWLFEKPIRAVLLLFALHVAVHQFVIDPRLRGERDDALTAAKAEVAAHRQTKEDYRLAQAEAARLERQRLARVEAEQQEITDEVVETYDRRLADARARAEQLRAEAARAGERAPGAGGAVVLPGAGETPGRADQAAADRGLPAGAFGRTEAEQLERDLVATEQALQLDALIDWALRQAGVQVNAVEAPVGPTAPLHEAGQ